MDELGLCLNALKTPGRHALPSVAPPAHDKSAPLVHRGFRGFWGVQAVPIDQNSADSILEQHFCKKTSPFSAKRLKSGVATNPDF